MHIQLETPDQPEVRAMLSRLDALHADLYPAESNHLLDVRALLLPEVKFLVARDDAGRAIGCAALVRRGDYAEIKRMFVDEAARGQGIGRALLDQLALHALASHLHALRLETGIHQLPALRLYEGFGFTRCLPFGDYQPDPLSVFMEKPL
jgi:putative acetyltransferase